MGKEPYNVEHRCQLSHYAPHGASIPENYHYNRIAKPVYLKLRCDKPILDYLIESPLGFDQINTEIDDSTFEIAVTVGDTQDLRWWLTAQATHCDILEPEWLGDEIERTLRKGLERSHRRKL